MELAYVNIVIRSIEADVEEYAPFYNRYDTTKAQSLTLAHQPYKVTKNGNNFYCVMDTIYNWGTYQSHDMGSINIIINESDYSVLSFELHDSTVYNDGYNISSWSAKGFGIPFYWKSESSLQQLLSSNVSAHITSFTWFRDEGVGLSNERISRLLNITGDNNATIEIYWSSQPP